MGQSTLACSFVVKTNHVFALQLEPNYKPSGREFGRLPEATTPITCICACGRSWGRVG